MQKHTTLSSEGLSTARKVSGNRTTYSPLEMSDASVFALAQQYFTLDQIASFFNVNISTLKEHHGPAFEAGKLDATQKPRVLMQRFFNEWAAKENLHDHELIPLGDGKYQVKHADFGALIKMMELHARKYEGLGKDANLTLNVTPPSISNLKFEPLTAENKDED